MPKNASASAKEISKLGGTSGGSCWSQSWSRAQALAELCVPPKAYEAAQNLRQRIEVELDEALAGQTARLGGDGELCEHRTPLLQTVALVRQKMEKMGLSAMQRMYPVLWVRLLRKAGVKLEGHVYQQLGEWRLHCEAEGAVVFALAGPSAKNPRASREIVQGGQNLEYVCTVEELLLRPTVCKGSPYTQTWALHVIPRSQPGVDTSTVMPTPAQTATAEAKKKLTPREFALAALDFIKPLMKLDPQRTMNALHQLYTLEKGEKDTLPKAFTALTKSVMQEDMQDFLSSLADLNGLSFGTTSAELTSSISAPTE